MLGKHRWVPIVAFIVFALLLVGCTQATGMGWIQPVVPGDVTGEAPQKATFGFTFYRDTSDPDSPAFTGIFRGSYHDPLTPDDPTDDVDFKGEGVLRRSASPPPGAPSDVTNCLVGSPPYEAQNPHLPPNLPRTGTFLLHVCDREDPFTGAEIDDDYISISITTGPYMGYTKAGLVQGNITVR